MDPGDGFSPLLRVLASLGGLDARVGGGWGVDLLAGRVTRAHHDVDLFVPAPALRDAAGRLGARGYDVVVDERPARLVLVAPDGTRVELNAVTYRPDGHGTQRDDAGDLELFPAWGWLRSTVDGRSVVCLSSEIQRIKHRGYPARPQDEADLAAIAHLDEPARLDRSVRPAEPAEADLVEWIETASDRLLERYVGAPLPPAPPGAAAAEAARTAITLVAGRPPVGFARIEDVDGHAHLGQLSVVPEYARLGIGTSLVEAASAWAARRGDALLTLTTFSDVPFNAPLYRRLGFAELTAAELGPELAGIVAAEAGLAPCGPRTAMARRLRRAES